jgi:hypothetical protein
MSIIELFEDKINGVFNTFDRMIIKGFLRPFFYQNGRMFYLSKENVLLKDFGKYAEKITEDITNNSKRLAAETNRPHIYLNSSKKSKEEIAKKVLKENPISEGLICILSVVEPCASSFEIFKNKAACRLELQLKDGKCKHLYFYYLDKVFGFMHVKVQTWFPFDVQIYINGREYMSKEFDKADIQYKMYDNSFTYISDVERAQEIANKIEAKNFSDMFDYFAKKVNPQLSRIFDIFKSGYYWCLDQCGSG